MYEFVRVLGMFEREIERERKKKLGKGFGWKGFPKLK